MATTIEDLLRSVPVGQLQQRCSDDHLLEISRWFPHWRDVSAGLGLSDVEEAQIDKNPGGLSRQNYDMLHTWKRRFLDAATYKKLANVFFNIGRQDLVERVRNLWNSEATPPAIPTTDVLLGVTLYAEYLKNVYKIKPCGDQWSPVVSKCYINQSTVESIEDFPMEKEEICTMAMINSQVEEVKNLKRSMEIGQVGLLRDGQRARCIIVEGIPGIGKSTFSWHLGVSWAQKEILHGYHLVVLLRLRDERVQRAKCVSDLFYHHDQTTQQSVVQWVTSLEGDGVMLVLDGYDELSSDQQTSSIYSDIIKGEVLPKMTVLVSSRPSANQNLRQLCQSQKCQYIVVIGFGKEEIQQYVDGALEHNKELRDQLKSYLEHHPHIHGLMYVPLNCAIVVQIFRDQMKNKSQPPQTHTEVYQLLVKTVLKRHEEKSLKPPATKRPKYTCSIPKKQSRIPWLGDVQEETVSQLLVLAKLAYDGTKEHQLIFHVLGGALETLGLLHEVPELYLESSSSSSYHFLHKTVQEFMAALYVSSLPPDERAKFVRREGMTMVVRFMAGLTKFQSEDERESIRELLEGEITLVKSLHSFFEAHDPDLVQKCMGGREWKLGSIFRLNPFDCYVIGYCIANSRQLWSLTLHGDSINAECMKMLTMVEKGRAYDCIKSIKLGSCKSLGDEGAIVLGTVLRENKVLTSLTLGDCGLGPKGYSEVCSAVGMNTSLTELDLQEIECDDQSIASLGTMLRENTFLKSLSLAGKLGPEGLFEVCSAVGMNTTLTSLDLSGNEFDDHSIASLGTMLRENKVLALLTLQHCGLGPKGLCEVCSAVEMSTTLTSLDLSGNKFDDQSIPSLGTMLRENKVLTSLKLVACELGPEGLCEVCSAVGMNNTLTSLDLSGNTFDDRSITSLGTMLRQSKVLTSLQIRGCELCPKGLCEVCSAVGMNTTLTSLDVALNTFDDQSIASLGTMLRENKVLTSLGLQWCRLGPEGLCEVCSAVGMNTTLTSLNLSRNKLNSKGIDTRWTMLRDDKLFMSDRLMHWGQSTGLEGLFGMNTTWNSIDLSLNTFDEKSIASLGTMLRENKVFTSLGLQSCKLGPEVLGEVCNAVAKNTTLTSLHLSGSKFDKQSIASLVHLLDNNQTLEYLNMSNCDLNYDVLLSLANGIKDSKLKKLNLIDNYFYPREATEMLLKSHPTLKYMEVMLYRRW